jgi:hypothetical protein
MWVTVTGDLYTPPRTPLNDPLQKKIADKKEAAPKFRGRPAQERNS